MGSIAHCNALALNLGNNAAAHFVSEFAWLRDGYVLRLGTSNDRTPQRMFGGVFVAACGFQEDLLGNAGLRPDLNYRRYAKGDRSCLIQEERMQATQCLQVNATLDNRTLPRRAAD